MFGGFVGFNNNQGGDWGENLLNKVATNTIRHLFTHSEFVEVAVRCNPSSKLLQGTIDSFKMSGRGLVIRKDFRTEEMSFETDAVSLDFGSVMQGKIALKQPTQAVAQVKLTETDLNQAFQAELVKKRLENLSAPALTEISGGEVVSFTDVELQLLPNNQVKLLAKANWSDRSVPVSLYCTLAVAKRRRIKFNDIKFEAQDIPDDVRDISQQLTDTLGSILNEMVDLDRFDLDGVKVRLNRLETKGKVLLFSGYAQIEKVPTR
ncbi:LmeA family phospholipid-binding protein [Hyella patelloides]